MDPEAALKSLDEALDCQDREGVFEFSDALIQWISAGGFCPLRSAEKDWRTDLTRNQLFKYLVALRSATGIGQNGEDVVVE